MQNSTATYGGFKTLMRQVLPQTSQETPEWSFECLWTSNFNPFPQISWVHCYCDGKNKQFSMNSEFSISNNSWYKFLTEFPILLLLQGIPIECKLKHCDRTLAILYLVLKTKMTIPDAAGPKKPKPKPNNPSKSLKDIAVLYHIPLYTWSSTEDKETCFHFFTATLTFLLMQIPLSMLLQGKQQ